MYDDSIKTILNIFKNKNINSVLISCEDGYKVSIAIENIHLFSDDGFIELFLNGDSENPLFISTQHIVSIQKV